MFDRQMPKDAPSKSGWSWFINHQFSMVAREEPTGTYEVRLVNNKGKEYLVRKTPHLDAQIGSCLGGHFYQIQKWSKVRKELSTVIAQHQALTLREMLNLYR